MAHKAGLAGANKHQLLQFVQFNLGRSVLALIGMVNKILELSRIGKSKNFASSDVKKL